jgi:hypothetical protein
VAKAEGKVKIVMALALEREVGIEMEATGEAV